MPEEELPPSVEGHRLTVVLAAPVLGEPQVASLWLPLDGASERVRFAFQQPDDVQVFGYTAEERNRARERELYWVVLALGLADVAIVSGLVWLL